MTHLHSPGGSHQRSPYQAAPHALHKKAHSTLTRHAPVDRTKSLFADTMAQDLAAESGSRRTLSTNIKDLGAHNNNNSLRFVRAYSYTSCLHPDGGPCYSPTICSGNWVEERLEDKYASGFHARELSRGRSHQTEHSARFGPPSEKVSCCLVFGLGPRSKGSPIETHLVL